MAQLDATRCHTTRAADSSAKDAGDKSESKPTSLGHANQVRKVPARTIRRLGIGLRTLIHERGRSTQATIDGKSVKFTGRSQRERARRRASQRSPSGMNSLVDNTPNPTTNAMVANKTGTPMLPAACIDETRATMSSVTMATVACEKVNRAVDRQPDRNRGDHRRAHVDLTARESRPTPAPERRAADSGSGQPLLIESNASPMPSKHPDQNSGRQKTTPLVTDQLADQPRHQHVVAGHTPRRRSPTAAIQAVTGNVTLDACFDLPNQCGLLSRIQLF